MRRAQRHWIQLQASKAVDIASRETDIDLEWFMSFHKYDYVRNQPDTKQQLLNDLEKALNDAADCLGKAEKIHRALCRYHGGAK